jgi:hypothetical protein
MSHNKTIKGVKMDRKIIELASRLVSGAGDGRLSLKDAEALMALVKDGNVAGSAETDTIDYILKNFHWTPAATEWFRKELKTATKKSTPVSISLAELSHKHFATQDVLSDPVARNTRKHALEAATSETNLDHDDIGLWIKLRDGSTVEVFSNFIELEEEFVQLRGGCLVPVRAIEKVEI